MSIWYHFEVISHSTVCLLSNSFNYHGLIKSKFNRLLVNHTLIAYQRSDSIGEYLWDDFQGGGECPWVNFNGYKYSVRHIKSINMIVVYILPSCQLTWDDMGRPVETGRKLKANTVQQLIETGCKLKANTVQQPIEMGCKLKVNTVQQRVEKGHKLKANRVQRPVSATR